jgi:nitrite reductase/ring-hydroxylating ferredoxin subunit
MMEPERSVAINQSSAYYDARSGILQARAFASGEVYRKELNSVFSRTWLFVAPENWLTRNGDFFRSRMGADEVVVWRGSDGKLRVFDNICVSSGHVLFSMSRGCSETVTCSCHGWRYNSCGLSPDLPGQEFASTAKLEVYKGLVLANRDWDAEPFLAAIGDFGWYLDILLAGSDGEIEAYGDDALRWTVDTNWKLAAEAYCGSGLIELGSNPSLSRDDMHDPGPTSDGFQASTRAGVISIVTQRQAALAPLSENTLGSPRDGFYPTSGTLFPNLSFDWRVPSFHVWHPIGRSITEIHSFCMVAKNASADAKEHARRAFQFQYGPAGMQSQRQSEIWRSISARISPETDLILNMQMGLGRERDANIPGKVGDLLSESNQRSFFRWWHEQLVAPGNVSRKWLQIAR